MSVGSASFLVVISASPLGTGSAASGQGSVDPWFGMLGDSSALGESPSFEFE